MEQFGTLDCVFKSLLRIPGEKSQKKQCHIFGIFLEVSLESKEAIMKTMKYTTLLMSICVFVSMYLVSADLVAMGPDVKVSTFTEIPMNQFPSDLPDDWSVRVWQGTPEIEIVKEHKGSVLRLRSHQSNVALYKKIQVDLTEHPNLSWKWKVVELPVHGDARDGQRDDQAAGIYVLFPRFPELFNTRIIGYIWDSDAPQGTILKSQNDSRIHYIVIRSGKQKTGRWVGELRNVGKDYEQIFGEKASMVGGVSLMIDSDHTQSSSESYFGKISFSSMPMLSMKQNQQDLIGR